MAIFTRIALSAWLVALLTGASFQPAGLPDQDLAKTIQQALKDASKAAADIPPLYERALALAEVARVQGLTGNSKAAKETFRRAVTTARTLPAKDVKQAEERCSLLFHIAWIMAASHDWDGAHALVDDIYANEPLRQFMPIPEIKRRSFEVQVARSKFAAGQFDQAVQTAPSRVDRDLFRRARARAKAEAKEWSQALEIAGQVESDTARAQTLADLVALRYQAGHKEEGRQLVQKIHKILDELKDLPAVYVRANLARAYAAMGDRRTALKMMEAVTLKSPYPYREESFVEVYLQLGDFANALKYARKAREVSGDFLAEKSFQIIVTAHVKAKRFKEAWQITEEMKEDTFRVQAILGIANAQHRAGLKDDANESFRIALQIAEKAPGRTFYKQFYRPHPTQQLFSPIAEAQAEVGEVAAARAWINRQIAANIQAYALIGLAEGLHKRLQAGSKK